MEPVDIAGERSMVEAREITLDEVVRAGRVLYGPGFAAEGGAWRNTLRATYRRRAMETHPDRARSLGKPERVLAREFAAVAAAYRLLSLVRGRPLPRPRRAAPPPAPVRPAERARARDGAARVRDGDRPQPLPQRPLRFAEYLYYSGRAAWSDLVKAIAWQRAQRPPIGRVAVDFGFLDPADVASILMGRRAAAAGATPFGEWAVREGFLTPFQVLAALGRQLREQRPIGQFFVERGLLDADEIDLVRRGVLRHNSRFREHR
jgi:hypothetical protein